MEYGIQVNLPKAAAAELPRQRSLSVTISDRGDIYLDHVRVNRSELAARLRAAAGSGGQATVVMVRADERASYGLVAEILAILHKSNIGKIALVTQEGNAPQR